MGDKVYYGEYSLKHWMKLMLTRNIVLPEYQRHFVWEQRDVKRLIQSLKDGQFVQPVTIALYNVDGKRENLILDGQQRLTSILLAYLGYFPDKKKFLDSIPEYIASEDDSALDDSPAYYGDNIASKSPILWKYTELIKEEHKKDKIIDKIRSDDKYEALRDPIYATLNDEFYEKTYLGFSYVVPSSTDEVIVQKNFSKLFRNINYFGKKLDPIESRKSLYYQNHNLTRFFEGLCQDNVDVLGGLKIMEDFKPYKIDFVRYLSILSQFSISSRKDAQDIMVGYSAYSSRERFYADYVSYILGLEQEDRVHKFDLFLLEITFPDNSWMQRFEKLKEAVEKIKETMSLKTENTFYAWYEADYWLFGLMYHILFEGKSLKNDIFRDEGSDIIITLKDKLETQIQNDKNNPMFNKNSNRLTFLRSRLAISYSIYSNYVQ